MGVKMTGNFPDVAKLKKNLEEHAKTLLAEKATKTLGALRCPVHGTGPTNIRVEPRSSGFGVRSETCCEELEKLAQQAFERLAAHPMR